MRKNIAIVASMVALTGVLSLTGCGESAAPQGSVGAPASTSANAKSPVLSQGKGKIAPDDLGDKATEDVEKTVASFEAQYEELVAQVNSFDAYKANVDAVQAYYDTVLQDTKNLCIRMRQYAADCANYVLSTNRTPGQMYDDLEVIYDDLYDGAGDDLYDAVYDDLFGNLYDAFYDGVVSDGYDLIGYGEWSELSSAAYEMYSDAHSDAYELISDCRSDIYEFGSDVRGDVFSDKLDKAKKELAKFQEDIDELKAE